MACRAKAASATTAVRPARVAGGSRGKVDRGKANGHRRPGFGSGVWRPGRDRQPPAPTRRAAGGAVERDLPGMGQEQQYQGEPIPVSRAARPARRGLRLPPHERLSVWPARRVRLDQPGAPVRAAQGRPRRGPSRPAGSNEKYPALLRIDTVSGMTPDEARQRPRFEDLTPLFPDEKLRLEVPGDTANMVARIVDLISPIGKGQRGLIVSPPKAGKTTVLKQIAHSIEANNPEVHLMVLLVDERPEEVTDMRRSVQGEVVASTFDRPSDEHTQVAELAIERAKRLVEMGRTSSSSSTASPAWPGPTTWPRRHPGRIMSGGIDTGACTRPRSSSARPGISRRADR